MRIKVIFNSKDDIMLPVDYNYYIQSFIYNNISQEMASFLHNKGYNVNGRKFKLFTFSKIFGKCTYDRTSKMFYFKPPISLYITSPIDEFIATFANHILLNNRLIIYGNKLEVENVSFERSKIEEEIKVKTLSPIVVYSTMYDAEGKKYTCYFMPREPKFNSLIEENLKKKIVAAGKEVVKDSIEIIPIGAIRQKILTYKGFTIKGSEGIFRLKGNSELLRMALDAGLGAKSSQGFGCIIEI